MSMSITEAAAEAGKWGNLIRSLSKLQETADFLFAQMQNQKDVEKLLASIRADIETAKAGRQQLEDDAKALVDDAKAEAEKIVANANAVASKVRADVAALKEQAEGHRVAADGAIVERNDALHAVLKAKDDLAAITAKIEEAKAKARALFSQ